MPCLTSTQLTQPRPVPRVRVDLPELGEGVYVWVHGFTARQRERFLARFKGPDREQLQQAFDAHRIVESCRDDDGNPVFTESDVESLLDQPNGLVDRLAGAAAQLDDGRNVTPAALAKNSLPVTPADG